MPIDLHRDSAPPVAWTTHLWVGAIYAAVTILLTLPLAATPSSELAGNALDMWIFPWATWWARQSIGAGESPFFTPLLYHPHGADLSFHTLALPLTGWSALLPDTLAPALLYNLAVLAAVLLSALGGYALAFQVTGSVPAAFLAGIIYGFTPNRLDQARAHLDCALGVFLPLTLLFALRALAASGARMWWNVGLAGAMLALGLLTRLEHAMAAALLLGLCLMVAPALASRRVPWHGLRVSAAIAAAAIAIGLPYIVQVARSWPPPEPPNGYRAQWLNTSIGIDRLVTPAPTSVLWSELSRGSVAAAAERHAGQVGFLGFVVVGLTVLGAVVCRRDPAWWFWTAAGTFILVLVLGPELVIDRHSTGIPLLFDRLPLLTLARAPNRFLPAAVLCLAVAAAIAWSHLFGAQSRVHWATALVAALLIADQAMLPFPTTPSTPSPFYLRLAASTDRSALVEIPHLPRMHDKLYLYYQTLHGRPIHGGHVSRRLAGTDAYIQAVPLLRALADPSLPPLVGPAELAADLHRLAADGFGYLLFHRSFAEPGLRGIDAREAAMMAAVASLRGGPIYEDERLVAFDLRADQSE